jgi:hypothetical protein
MDSSVQFFKSNLQGADIVAAGERSLVTVCKVAQKCVFDGRVIPRDGDVTEPYWDTIDAKTAR